MIDWYQLASLLIMLLFGTQGVRAWMRQKGIKKGTGKDTPQSIAAADYLTGYYQKELGDLRGDLRRELEGVRREVRFLQAARNRDAEYIDMLEAHIWLSKPPPPPARPTYKPKSTEEDPS